MFRKLMIATASVMAIMGASVAPAALAQGSPTCVLVALPDPDPSAAPESDAGEDAAELAGSDRGGDNGDNVDTVFAAPDCAPLEAYPGPFTNMPTVPSSPFLTPADITVTEPVDVVVVEVTSERAGADLAHSGTESYVLAYFGTGLLAFGAVAMGMRRGSRLPER